MYFANRDTGHHLLITTYLHLSFWFSCYIIILLTQSALAGFTSFCKTIYLYISFTPIRTEKPQRRYMTFSVATTNSSWWLMPGDRKMFCFFFKNWDFQNNCEILFTFITFHFVLVTIAFYCLWALISITAIQQLTGKKNNIITCLKSEITLW